MKEVDAFWTWVENRIDEIGLGSFRELERRSGFAPGAIGKRRNTNKFPTVEMAQGMCRALEVSWFELWMRAGFTTESQVQAAIAEEKEILDVFRSLTGARRNAMLDMVRGMRARPGTPAAPAEQVFTIQDLPAKPLMSPEALERALDWWSEILSNAPEVAQPMLVRLLHMAAEWYEQGRDVEQLMEDILGDESIVASIRRRIEEEALEQGGT